jgi:hypothetical protein
MFIIISKTLKKLKSLICIEKNSFGPMISRVIFAIICSPVLLLTKHTEVNIHNKFNDFIDQYATTYFIYAIIIIIPLLSG